MPKGTLYNGGKAATKATRVVGITTADRPDQGPGDSTSQELEKLHPTKPKEYFRQMHPIREAILKKGRTLLERKGL